MKNNQTKDEKETNKKRKNFVFFKVIGIIYTLLAIIFFISILKTNLLPRTHLMLLATVQLLLILLINKKLTKSGNTYKLNILYIIIAIVFSIIHLYGINYANATRKFLTEVFPKVEEKMDYIDNGVLNVYISGIDNFESIDNTSRSDANILLTINTKTNDILLTSIPRDYYVILHSKGEKDKLTHSGMYGIDETIATVEDLLEIKINYYIKVDFTTLIKVIDVIDGVEVYSDYSFSRNGYTFKEGYNYLDGEAALVFSRERYAFKTGDNQRIKNQQYVIEAIINKISTSTKILTKYTSILEALTGAFESNIEQEVINNLVKEQLRKMSSWKIKKYTLTGTDANKETYSYKNQSLYVMIPNENSIRQAKEKIEEIEKNNKE